MPLLALAAAASFACASPQAHGGDALRCAGFPTATRLYGIDIAGPLSACAKPGACPAGPAAAAREHLAHLIKGRIVTCKAIDVTGPARAECSAGDLALSCAMVRDGYATARYALADCDTNPGAPVLVLDDAVLSVPPVLQRWWPELAGLLALNAVAYAAMRSDKARADRGGRRIPELLLLLLAMLGGSLATVLAQLSLDHKTHKQPFAALLLLIVGVQAGMLAGVAALGWR